MNPNRWNVYLKPFLNLFLKSNCPLCQRPTGEDFCLSCQRQLLRCQFSHGGHIAGKVPIVVWGQYSGILKRAIAALKYENQPQIARPLGHWLGTTWLNSPHRIVDKLTVVPIPLHAAKQKERGFNQAELLADSFCELTELPLQRHGLERVKNTQALFELSKAERQQTVVDAFRLGTPFRRRHPPGAVLLLDDIYTTGATTESATQTLMRQGIKVAGVVAVATTQPTLSVTPD